MARRIAGIAFVALVALAMALQVQTARVVREAQAHYEAAAQQRPWSERIGDARAAVALRPEIIAYRQRAASLQAERYVEIGALDKARNLLIEAWALDRSAMYLREQLRGVNALIWARDSRKAHVLHGREKPGGVLEPDDLMP